MTEYVGVNTGLMKQDLLFNRINMVPSVMAKSQKRKRGEANSKMKWKDRKETFLNFWLSEFYLNV